MIGEKEFSLMKSNSVIINTARGPIVKESALIKALSNKQINGAALDVFEDEPINKDNPLLDMDNVILSPHNSNSSPKAWERVHLNTINKLIKGRDKSPGCYIVH